MRALMRREVLKRIRQNVVKSRTVKKGFTNEYEPRLIHIIKMVVKFVITCVLTFMTYSMDAAKGMC